MSATRADLKTVPPVPATFIDPARDFSDGLQVLRDYHASFVIYGSRLLTLAEALRAQRPDESDASHAAEARTLLDYYEQATWLHHQDEERALFPLILNRSFLIDGMVERLAVDHKEIEDLWAKLREALRTSDRAAAPLPASELATRFERSLRTHIEREDLDFFPLLETLLSPEQRANLGERMARLRGSRGSS